MGSLSFTIRGSVSLLVLAAAIIPLGLLIWIVGLSLFGIVFGPLHCIVPEYYNQGCLSGLRLQGGQGMFHWMMIGIGMYTLFVSLDLLGIKRVREVIEDYRAHSRRRQRQMFAYLESFVTR